MPWLQLAFFAITVELLALYGLAFSGHFPAEFRNPELSGGAGAILLAAPLLLRPFPDRFANGLAGLATFAMSALGAAILFWAAG
jgi:hypothetical protein